MEEQRKRNIEVICNREVSEESIIPNSPVDPSLTIPVSFCATKPSFLELLQIRSVNLWISGAGVLQTGYRYPPVTQITPSKH